MAVSSDKFWLCVLSSAQEVINAMRERSTVARHLFVAASSRYAVSARFVGTKTGTASCGTAGGSS